jgi:dTMP kinase
MSALFLGTDRMAAGKFITFEGGEGSGKSTQARRLADRLRGEGVSVSLTREPGGSPFAEALRGLLLDPNTPPHSALSEALLFYAARADHLDKTIRPALSGDVWVICDRFSDSTLVYQGKAGGLPDDIFTVLEKIVVAPTMPDLTFILDLPAEQGLARARSRREKASTPDAYEGRELAYHRSLRDGFKALARSQPERCVLIDASQDEAAVASSIWRSVEERLLAEAR